MPISMTLPHLGPNYFEFSSNYAISIQFKLQMALYCIKSAAYIQPSLTDLNIPTVLVSLSWPQHPMPPILKSIFLNISSCPRVFTHALFTVQNAFIPFLSSESLYSPTLMLPLP